ncbi:MAG: CARDB domain-containing protein [Actinomycetota bacterium]
MRLALALLSVLLFAAAPAGADSVTELALPANDLYYERASGLIYASVPGRAGLMGNTITRFDPLTGETVGSVFVGSEPGVLAPTDDGQHLYVGLNGAIAVRRYSLLTQTPGAQFSTPAPVERMVAIPGQPLSVATLGDYSAGAMEIFDDGVRRTYSSPQYPIWYLDHLVAGLSPSRLYGVGSFNSLYRIESPPGKFFTTSAVQLSTPFPPGHHRSQRGLLFSTLGGVFDPEAGVTLGTFVTGADYFSSPLVCPDLPGGRVFFLIREGFQSYSLQAYDARTFTFVGSLALPSLPSDPGSLIRWGTDGLAFRAGDKVYLIRTTLAPQDNPTVDLEVSGAETLPLTPAGESHSYTLTVQNSGSDAATFASLTDTLPPSATILSATASQGQAYIVGSVVTARLGEMAPGASANVTVEVRFAVPGPTSHTALATSFETDVDPSDDTLTQTVNVTTPVLAELNLEWTSVKVVCPRIGKCRYSGKLKVRNQGGTDARKFVVRFYTSSDRTLDSNDGRIAEVKVARLAKGRSATVRLNAKAFRGRSPYYVLAVIDAAGVVEEANEADNVAASSEF